MNSNHRFKQLVDDNENSTQLISILSGKGGVGKSLIALNLAERLSAIGDRVLLVDADLTGGNLHIMANTGTEHSIQKFIAGSVNLNESVIKTKYGFDLLVSLFGTNNQEMATVTNAITFSRQLRIQANNYDLVIIDHSSGISEFATVIANASNINLMVLIPELTSIADCFGLLKYLYKINQSIDCRLVANRIYSKDEAIELQERFRKATLQFLGKAPTILPSISEDSAFRRSIASQAPLASVDPQANAIQELNNICSLLSITKSADSGSLQNENINIKPAKADIRG